MKMYTFHKLRARIVITNNIKATIHRETTSGIFTLEGGSKRIN
jgi:hypothetical protein